LISFKMLALVLRKSPFEFIGESFPGSRIAVVLAAAAGK